MDRRRLDRAKINRRDVPLAGLGLPDAPDISWPRDAAARTVAPARDNGGSTDGNGPATG